MFFIGGVVVPLRVARVERSIPEGLADSPGHTALRPRTVSDSAAETRQK